MTMRGMLTLCVGALMLLGLARPARAADKLVLRDMWQLQSSAELDGGGEAFSTPNRVHEGWYDVDVPTTVLAALVEEGVYPDPYYADNLKKIPGFLPQRWLVMPKDSPFYPSWWFRTDFETPDAYAGKHVILHLDGVNFRANVWLNGVQIAHDDDVAGMFRRFEFDVTALLLPPGQDNALAVEVIAPGHIPDKRYRTKQVEATTGWDDHNPQPPDLNMGLWRDVYLTASGPVALRHAHVAADLDVPGLEQARLTPMADLVNTTAEPVNAELTVVIEDITARKTVALEPGETRTVTLTTADCPALTVDNPRVWWPVDVGPQELYDAQFTCTAGGQASDAAEVRFGIRHVHTYLNDEGWRTYEINGRKILIRGGAWMTVDMMLRLTHRRYEALVRYAKEGHLNMLRSEGFSIRETQDFYNLCDEHGIMVTQQLFGRSIPDEDLAIDCIRDTLLRIRTHPSLVHFLGHDETFPTERLDAAYQEMIAQYCPDRTYQPHSGAFMVSNRWKTGGTRTGSLQTWQHVGPAHYYISKSTGAWGFAQSGGIGGVFASLESMRRMLPEEALWPPFTDLWSFHTVMQGGAYFGALQRNVSKRYGEATDIEDFLRKGFMLNYECARAMYEAYGRNKFKATGITTWKYDAAWPAGPTWQYIDWYLIPTGAYYGAKKACEPLHVQYSYDDHSVWVVNNYYKPFDKLRVTARGFVPHSMAERFRETKLVGVGANGAVEALKVDWRDESSTAYFLHLTLEDASGQRITDNFYWLSRSPEIVRMMGLPFTRFAPGADYTELQNLPPVKLDAAPEFNYLGAECEGKVTLTNPTEHIAFAVHLAAHPYGGGPEISPAYWSENYFSVLPGETRVVDVRIPKAELGNRGVQVAVNGWNLAK